MTDTQPVTEFAKQTAPTVTVPAHHKDSTSGALWVHKDLVQVREAWDDEAHIGPVDVDESFGDVESWARYLERFGAEGDYKPFATWNARGLRAVLDYHHAEDGPGRCSWVAAHPFILSREWQAWMRLADGSPRSQQQVVEALEDRAEDVQQPSSTDLAAILRSLRATANATAQTELKPDGSSSVAFTQEKTIRGASPEVTLPAEFLIAIPVLKGHATRYGVRIRIRASVDNNAHLALRLTAPNAEATLEGVYGERVEAAKALLGEGLPLLRAAD